MIRRRQLRDLSASLRAAYVASAIDPQVSRPYWGPVVPPGGFLPECAGSIITKTGYQLVPARSTYTEMTYSASCNQLLTRPPNMIKAEVWVHTTGKALCSYVTRFNTSSTDWNVVATGGNCPPVLFVTGRSTYNNVAVGFPAFSATAT